jgi:hypothetical protein
LRYRKDYFSKTVTAHNYRNSYLSNIAINNKFNHLGMSDAHNRIATQNAQEEIKMKKVISTIVVMGFISSMLVSTAFAGQARIEIFNPLWIPVAILSTIAAATTITIPGPPAVYAPPMAYSAPPVVYAEPRPTVIYEAPQYYQRPYVRYYDGYNREYARPGYRYNYR